ncbi:MAG: peptide deformylase [Lachnospiraceae bacterium]|nr:peptide deformylase [Lachnospiraceae bacterium]
MIQPIMKDVIFLSQKAEPATPEDKQAAMDLLDTLKAHEGECVGMAANMIGVNKAIIAVNIGFMNLIMYNPEIIKKAQPFQTEEGCLSFVGVRKCTRYKEIEVRYQDVSFKQQCQKLNGWTAQIVQHEVDHLHGKII